MYSWEDGKVRHEVGRKDIGDAWENRRVRTSRSRPRRLRTSANTKPHCTRAPHTYLQGRNGILLDSKAAVEADLLRQQSLNKDSDDEEKR